MKHPFRHIYGAIIENFNAYYSYRYLHNFDEIVVKVALYKLALHE